MNYKVETIANFDREAKRLAKKFPSLKNEITELIGSLETNPFQGDALGNHSYKIRLAIASKGKGKSGGARVITCIKIMQQTVFLISIYDKSEQEDISGNEIKSLINSIPK